MASERNPEAARQPAGPSAGSASATVNREIPRPSLFVRLRSSSLALIVANLVPIYGVLALDWKVGTILVFYWTENLVVGFFNVLKMARAKGAVDAPNMTFNNRPVTQDSRKGLIFFFIVHYGGFTLGHGIFVLALFHPERQSLPGEIGLALLILLASHGVSYRRNYIRSGEYLHASFARLFWQPYARVIIMHITILAGGALAQHMGSPLGALLVLVALKTLIDLGGHWLEHKRYSVRI